MLSNLAFVVIYLIYTIQLVYPQTTVSPIQTSNPTNTLPTAAFTSNTISNAISNAIPSAISSATPSAIPSANPKSTSSVSTNGNKVIVVYYSYWKRSFLAENNLPWTKITHVNFAFAIVDAQFNPVLDAQTRIVLSALVTYAHVAKVKVLLSVGGWTGSQYFSTLASNAASRATFINATVSIINQLNLDGVDIDWEYPGRQGMICNAVNQKDDANNFLTLLTELRAALGNDKLLTLAVSTSPFNGPNGTISDVSPFAKLVDWVNIMAYDVSVSDGNTESWVQLTGPNAPFDIPDSTTNRASFKSSISNWMNAGMPSSKIVMGVEFMGRAQTALEPMSTSQYVKRDPVVPEGDQSDQMSTDSCPGANSSYSGIWTWGNLRQQGLLSCTLEGSSSWKRNFDNITQTPWLYNSDTNIYISYDDPKSLYVKATYTKQQGLRGMAVWEISDDNGQELLNTIQVLNKNIASPTNDCSTLSGPAIAGITLGLATLLSIATFIYYWYKNKTAAVIGPANGK
ncbi:26807_t:CDS:2, partial [Gigaspora margarita]